MQKNNPNKKILTFLLRGEEYRTEDELAKILGVSTKTIERWIEEIELLYPNTLEKITKRKKGSVKGERLRRIYDPSTKTSGSISNTDLKAFYEAISSFNDISISHILNIVAKNQLNEWLDAKEKSDKGLATYQEIISKIKNAIRLKKEVILKNYYSRNHGVIKQKRIIPILLDENNRKIYAIDNGEKKYFKFENFDKVEDLKGGKKHYIDWNPLENRDVFGFLPNDDQLTKIHVTLHLDRFARSQLLTQFPHIFEYLKKIKNKSPFCYELAIQVYDIEPIARFVTGLFDRIKIVGDIDAKDKIEKYYLNKVVKGYKENYR